MTLSLCALHYLCPPGTPELGDPDLEAVALQQAFEQHEVLSFQGYGSQDTDYDWNAYGQQGIERDP